MSRRNKPIEKRKRREAKNKRKALAARVAAAAREVEKRLQAAHLAHLRGEEPELVDFAGEPEKLVDAPSDPYEQMKMDDLKGVAKVMGLPKASTYRRKAELIAALREYEREQGEVMVSVE